MNRSTLLAAAALLAALSPASALAFPGPVEVCYNTGLYGPLSGVPLCASTVPPTLCLASNSGYQIDTLTYCVSRSARTAAPDPADAGDAFEVCATFQCGDECGDGAETCLLDSDVEQCAPFNGEEASCAMVTEHLDDIESGMAEQDAGAAPAGEAPVAGCSAVGAGSSALLALLGLASIRRRRA